MTTVTVQIDERSLRRALRALSPEAFGRALSRIVQRGTVEVRDLIAVYPPEGPWNHPAGPGSRWYQRHFGPRWMRMDGSIGGRNTSEVLQKSWRVRTRGKSSEVYTNVSYAPFVQGEQQTRYHRQHGWRTAQDVANDWRDTRLDAVVHAELDRVLGGEHV